MVFGLKCQPQVVGPRDCFNMVWENGFERSINLYKERIIRPRCVWASDEYLMKCEIQMLVMACLIWTKVAFMWRMMNDGTRSQGLE